MNAYALVQMIYDVLGEESRTSSNFVYTFEGLVRAINRAQGAVLQEMAKCCAGWFETSGNLSIAAGDLSKALPSDCAIIRRIHEEDGAAIPWSVGRGPYPLAGVRLQGTNLVWDADYVRAMTWVVEYVRRPGDARTGTLGDQAGAPEGNVYLPASDSGGAVSVTDDAYNGWSLGFLEGTAEGEHSAVSEYSGSPRQVALSVTPGATPVLGDKYILCEVWPDLWDEVLAYHAASRVAREGQALLGPPYAELLARAQEAGRWRQTQQSGETIYHPDS